MLVALIRPCNARSKTITNKRFTTRNILFLIAICLSLSEVRTIPTDYTWYGAQKTCQEKNDSLTIQERKSDEYYWTGYHERISKWIKLIGCYYDQDIVNYKHFNMFNSSAGLCQEYCTSDGYAYFAIKSRRCHCLMVLPTTHSTIPHKPLCNFSCENKFDDKLSTECGSNMAFNVFGTIEEEFHDQLQYNCLTLQCGNKSKRFITENCRDALNALCGENLAIRDTYCGWRNQLEKCIVTYNTYLYGDVDVRNAAAACQNIHMSFESHHWIGVLREQYQSEDRGLSNISKTQVTLCQKCNRDGCMFTDCYKKLRNTVFCKTLKVTIPPQGFAENDNKEIVAAIVTPIVVLGAVIAFGIIYFRRCKGNATNESTNSKNLEAENSESHQYACVDNSNIIDNVYLALEHESHISELDNTTKSESENPYYNLAEGEYSNVQNK
ncbi:uncharacterized protein LOC125655765 isoform X3 [Ostrea edulis]|uniref:uncharacterized protein LOC125655765 isoform X3 n=1 Tax=Ostrea edulis TaxID=37623 RepID=UPI0024AFE3CE|nr:uncharacterized protein LOC125655765 isoform X3 [Ostrea edulis]